MNEVVQSRRNPTHRNLIRSNGVLPATGCPTNLTVASAAPLDFISTALDAYYTAAPASTLLLRRNKERARRLTRIYGYTEIIYDPNIDFITFYTTQAGQEVE